MRIAFLVQGLEAARTRYRVLQYLPYFLESGVEARVFDVPREKWPKRRLFSSMEQYDVVILQKRLFGDRDFALLRKKANRLIFDVDDAVMEKLDDSPRKKHRRRYNFKRTVKECDLVFAGNAYLEKIAHDLGAPTIRVPTCVDLALYPVRKEFSRTPEDHSIKIGWIGSRSNLPYLEALKPVFEQLGAGPVSMELHIICDTFFGDAGLPVIRKPWSLDQEVADLMELDIGLAPLPDNVWTRGKSATKVVQYLAAGMPVVCSPVGANAMIVQDGINGYYARSPKEWVEKTLRLAKNPEERFRMGMAGRKVVEKNYSVQSLFPKVLCAVRSLAAQDGQAASSSFRRCSVALTRNSHNRPLVSVVIPAYNHEKFVLKAIESVMEQSCRSLELIVIDDGSTDQTAKVVRGACERYSGRIRFESRENRGLVRTLNEGIRLAKGKYWCQLASDDVMEQGNIARKVDFLEKYPLFHAVCSDAWVLESDGTRRRMLPQKAKPDPVKVEHPRDLFRTKLFFPSLLFRKVVFDLIGSFDESLRYYEDIEMKLRLLTTCRVGYLDEPLLIWRSHEGNTSLQTLLRRKERIIAYEKFFSNPAIRRYHLLRRRILGDEYYKYARLLIENRQTDPDHPISWYLFNSLTLHPFRPRGYYCLLKSSLLPLPRGRGASLP